MIWYDGKKAPGRRMAVETTENYDGRSFRPFRKLTVTYASKVDEVFQVSTPEGIHDGKAGDWLAIGAHGEMYPIDAAVFEETYVEIVEGSQEPTRHPLDGMNTIDAAIAELLAPLGEGWHVIDVLGHIIRVEPLGGPYADLIAKFKATIGNHEGLRAEGEGNTVGDALAMAYVVVQKQALRSVAR